ncbi:hypothetical protein DsansV1_C04g0036781 [Dioscorea sansibarensis]
MSFIYTIGSPTDKLRSAPEQVIHRRSGTLEKQRQQSLGIESFRLKSLRFWLLPLHNPFRFMG